MKIRRVVCEEVRKEGIKGSGKLSLRCQCLSRDILRSETPWQHQHFVLKASSPPV
jgi:hypothetical protein